MRRLVEAVRSGEWLTRERVLAWSAALLSIELVCFAFAVAGTHGWVVPLDHPVSSDFVSFYGAGRLVDAGTPALAYDRAAHAAAEQAATEPGIPYNFFFYPPTFLPLCGLLSRLPYLLSFVVFQAATLTPCLLLLRRIVHDAPVITLLAFPAVAWTLGTGQNALLSASLLGAATLAIDRRPVIAGLCAGALCYKPHLAWLLPIAFVAGGHWRAIAAAAGSLLALVGASWLAFGTETWRAFFAAVVGQGATVYGSSDAPLDLAGMTSPFGLVLALGGGSGLAAALQLLTICAVVPCVAVAWRRGGPLAPRAAILLAAIPLTTPTVMFYDLMLTGLALAWLVRDGLAHGFPPWTRSLLALLFLLPLTSGNLGFATQIAIPPAAALVGFLLAARQTFRRASAASGCVRPFLPVEPSFS